MMSKAQQNVLERLWAVMPSKERVIAQTKEGAVYGEYVELSQILRRLQEVFGLNYEIRLSEPTVYYEKDEPSVVAVSAVVSVMQGENPTVVQGYGTSSVNRGLENAIKSAETDAIKRACRLLGIGMFLYEKEVRFAKNEGQKRGQKGKSATSAKGKNGNGDGNGVRDQILKDKTLVDTVRRIAEDATGEEMTLSEIAEMLTEKVSEKQAWILMRYPDILQEALEEEDKDVLSELVGTAISRMKNREDWRDYYLLTEDEEGDTFSEEEEVVDDFFAD